jgi:alkanesulfonate monooxygenase SsuD/methylene tetrahydromethanopterin reductase-like flavin-dependent oxidoreductase (luciferase family)
MQISLMLEGQSGLTWAAWREMVHHVDRWAFHGLYTSDHFVPPTPAYPDALEMILAHSYTAAHTERVVFGPMVAPFSFRDPALLARQAAALDDLSGGRMILGVGAGWMEREHKMFGYPLGDRATRMARLAEGLQVVHLLLRASGPVSFDGRFFTLRDAEIRPRPGSTRILVGGNGIQRTLRLAAQYADVWNGVQLSPASFQERSARLDEYARDAGRDPSDIKRTVACFFFFGSDGAELERRLAYVRSWDQEMAVMPLDELCSRLRRQFNAIVGFYPQVTELVHEYAAAGVEELILQWFAPTDVSGIHELAQDLLPQLQNRASGNARGVSRTTT